MIYEEPVMKIMVCNSVYVTEHKILGTRIEL